MAGLTHDQKRAFIHKIIEVLEENTQVLTAKGYDPAAKIAELTTQWQAQEQAEAAQIQIFAAHKAATSASNATLKVAYENASASVELIVGLLGKHHPLVEILKNIRDLMNIEKPKKEEEKPPEKPQEA